MRRLLTIVTPGPSLSSCPVDRRRLSLRLAMAVAVVAGMTAAFSPGAMPALAAAGDPQLPVKYDFKVVQSPAPVASGSLGGTFDDTGDVNGDGKDDILVGTGEPTTNAALDLAKQVFVLNGATGLGIRTIPDPDASNGGTPTNFGTSVSTMADLGSCPGFTGTPGTVCPAATIGPADGVKEQLVSAAGVDVDATADDIGRVYVLDGATGALLKRIDMPAADRADQRALNNKPVFGRYVTSPAGQAPCAGNRGIGTCPTTPAAVKNGDVNGGGQPDIVVGASDYSEAGPAANPSCTPGPCTTSGRAYVYAGEAIAGSNPSATLSTPLYTVKNPMSQWDDPNAGSTFYREHMAYQVIPVGDMGSCTDATKTAGAFCNDKSYSTTQDGKPDFVLSGSRVDLPGVGDAGVAFLIDGNTGALLHVINNPSPQERGLFSFSYNSTPVIGDVGGSSLPDVWLASGYDGTYSQSGRGYALSGDFRSQGNPTSVIGVFDDPTPRPQNNFGQNSAGIGNVAGDSLNEILVGSRVTAPFSSQLEGPPNDAFIISPSTGRVLQQIIDPQPQPGDGFAGRVSPMGDLNGDGFLDFAIGASGFDGDVGADEGRIYLVLSNNQAAPTLPTVPTLAGQGYRMVATDGGIFNYGLGFFGSTGGTTLSSPVVGMANTASRKGYWLVAADGGIFAFGDAVFKGSAGSTPLAKPIVGMETTPSGNGYWLVASDGGIFAYGDATFQGSAGGGPLNKPIVGMERTLSGNGYWLVASDGGIFAYGDATFRGSTGDTRLEKPIVGMERTLSGNGYWLVASDGGIFAYGDATFRGSTGGTRLEKPIVGMARTTSGNGYWLVASDGGIFSFGDAPFLGSVGGTPLAKPIVGLAA